jgi:hypothetical protein
VNSPVRFELRDGIATRSLNRPYRLNAFLGKGAPNFA